MFQIDIDFQLLYSAQNEGISQFEEALNGLIEKVSLKYKDCRSSKLVSLLERNDTSKGNKFHAKQKASISYQQMINHKFLLE